MHIFEVLNRGKFLKGDKDEISKMGLEGLGLKMRKNASKTRQNKKMGMDGITINLYFYLCEYSNFGCKFSKNVWYNMTETHQQSSVFPQIHLIHALKET